MTQTSVWRLRTGMPSPAARSVASAPARIAMPASVAAQEHRERDERERHDDERDDVGALERDGADREVHVERLRNRAAGRHDPRRQLQRGCREELRQADRRDGEDQARRAAEPADDADLDQRAQRDRGHQTDEERGPPAEAGAPDHQEDGERRRDQPQVAGGEVHDPVGPVDERDAEREQRREPADERALRDHAGRHRPCEAGEQDDRDRHREPRPGATVTPQARRLARRLGRRLAVDWAAAPSGVMGTALLERGTWARHPSRVSWPAVCLACPSLPPQVPGARSGPGVDESGEPAMNVLLITTDQQRADSVGAYGNPVCTTPNLDALAAGGARFTAARTQHMLCQPSRATILTGTYPSTHGVVCNGVDLPERAVDDSVATHFAGRGLPHRALRQGALRQRVPVRADRARRVGRGFGARARRLDRPVLRLRPCAARPVRPQHADGTATGKLELVLRARADGPALRAMAVPRRSSTRGRERLAAMQPEASGHVWDHTQTWPNALAEEDHPTTWIADRALDWLRAVDEPFFAWVSFTDPHHPMDAPRPWCDRYDPADVLEMLPEPHPEEFDAKPPLHRAWTQGMRGRMFEFANPGGALYTREELARHDRRLLRDGEPDRPPGRTGARAARRARHRRRHARRRARPTTASSWVTTR